MGLLRGETGVMMHLLRDFFTTDVGLMSAAVIAFILCMGVYIGRYVARQVREDTRKHMQELQDHKQPTS